MPDIFIAGLGVWAGAHITAYGRERKDFGFVWAGRVASAAGLTFLLIVSYTRY